MKKTTHVQHYNFYNIAPWKKRHLIYKYASTLQISFIFILLQDTTVVGFIFLWATYSSK